MESWGCVSFSQKQDKGVERSRHTIPLVNIAIKRGLFEPVCVLLKMVDLLRDVSLFEGQRVSNANDELLG